MTLLPDPRPIDRCPSSREAQRRGESGRWSRGWWILPAVIAGTLGWGALLLFAF